MLLINYFIPNLSKFHCATPSIDYRNKYPPFGPGFCPKTLDFGAKVELFRGSSASPFDNILNSEVRG